MVSWVPYVKKNKKNRLKEIIIVQVMLFFFFNYNNENENPPLPISNANLLSLCYMATGRLNTSWETRYEVLNFFHQEEVRSNRRKMNNNVKKIFDGLGQMKRNREMGIEYLLARTKFFLCTPQQFMLFLEKSKQNWCLSLDPKLDIQNPNGYLFFLFRFRFGQYDAYLQWNDQPLLLLFSILYSLLYSILFFINGPKWYITRLKSLLSPTQVLTISIKDESHWLFGPSSLIF